MYTKIQTLSIHRPTTVNQQGQSRNQKSTLGSSAPFPPKLTTQEVDIASFGDDLQATISRLLTEDESYRVIPIMGMEGDRDKEIGQISHLPAQKHNGLRTRPASIHSSPSKGPTRRAQNMDLED